MRSLDLIGRVLKNVRRHGVTTSEVLDEDVLDELNQGQNQIISEINPDKIFSVVFKTGIDSYSLSATETEESQEETTMLNFVNNDLSGTKNGVNAIFTFPTTPVEGTEIVFLNGNKLKRDIDYTFHSTYIVILTLIPESDDYLDANYFEEAT